MSRSAYLKKRYQELRRRGRCVTCAMPSDGGTRCQSCRRRHTQAQTAYRDDRELRTGKRTMTGGIRKV